MDARLLLAPGFSGFFSPALRAKQKLFPASRLTVSKLQHLGILAVIVIMKMRNVADIFSRAAVKQFERLCKLVQQNYGCFIVALKN